MQYQRRSILAILTLFTLLCSDIPTLSATPVQDDTAGSWTDTFAATSGSLASSSRAGINTASGAIALTKNNGSGQFNVPYYSTGSVMSVAIIPTTFAHWNQLTFSSTNSGANVVTIQVYHTDGVTLVSDTDLPGNSTGFTSSPVDLSTIPYGSTIGQIKLKASFVTANTNFTPRLNDWTVTWTLRSGIANNPTPATGPWSALGRDNRNTSQMDGTLAPAYTPLWANNQSSSWFQNILTASGDVVVINKRSVSTDPYSILVLSKETGAIKSTFVLDSLPTTVSAKQTSASIQAVTKDNTIYFSRGFDDGDGGKFASFGALRNGQLLWSRYVNQYSGYSQWLSLDNSGSILIRSGHGNTSKYTLTGSKLWEAGQNYWNWAGPLGIGSNNAAYIRGSDGNFRIRGSATGASLAYVNLPTYGAGGAPIVDTDGSAFVTADGGCPSNTGYMLHISSTGTTLWNKSFNGGLAPHQIGMAMDANHIYVQSACYNTIYVINKSDGTVARTIGNGTAITAGASNYYGPVLVDHASQTLSKVPAVNVYKIHSSSGSMTWNFTMPGTAGMASGDSSQFYVSWGTGTLAFRPWTLSASAASSTTAGASMTITATSSMLAADPATAEANKVQAVMADGKRVGLSYDHTDSNNNSVWIGHYVTPGDDPGGTYTATIEASNARVQTSTGTTFTSPANGTNNTGLTTTATYTLVSQHPRSITSSTSEAISAGGGGGGGRSYNVPINTFSSSTSSVSSANQSNETRSSSTASSPSLPSSPLQDLGNQHFPIGTLLFNTNFRTAPTTNSPIITVLLKDWQVSVLSTEGQWSHVETLISHTQGYLFSPNLSLSAPLLPSVPHSSDSSSSAASSGVHTLTALNVHADADMASKTIAQLPKDAPVTILQTIGAWFEILFDNARKGYVVSRWVK